jgi:hypothetical protein
MNKFLGLYNQQQLEFSCLTINLNQNTKQNMELRFSMGRLIYTNRGVFDFSGSCDVQFNANSKKFQSFIRPRFLKSSMLHIIGQRQKYAGSEVTSSSEDDQLHWHVDQPLSWP